ncbi:MAG: MobF family relaxase [Bradyrhizobium sp.]|uniref:Relaxase domain-containing protein n=1 Tax=Bradyrhizobium denitrificans TaxID=2734912 RepID=A0ABS5GJ64_9BRAD|nr:MULTISPECIES: MobF family relaxase [Bradyrhizobium]MBR1141382.1 relaxase domain-containing protein [Bradyrhizobium denitrificans]MDU0953608.1 MobF family relaxase [Bradyrhizobium sp.]MDU1497252.1 MobF family relaxase [Bradyrhizobium sp.]MDU1547298.1 MobF family relaxase [Bradyrhizobium sp.]MDU1664671.1 MobF family relaxase [Bradyrhizobium sp.]
MVATWNPAAASSYYTRQRETEYYAGSGKPPGIWYAPAGDFGLVDGSSVDRLTFDRLYHARDESGSPLLEQIRRHKERTPAFDITLSAPRSVSLVWGLGSYDTKRLIEAAQQKAVRATLAMLEREATWARRGFKGAFLEGVALSSATFQHGESRKTLHSDGRVFADPNLHTHCVCLNIATRPSDHTAGGLHSKIIRDFKMAAGATYHAALAHELEKIGFAIDRVGKNGVFEIAGINDATIKYFSARRQEIEDELAGHGVTSGQAAALAAAIAKATRSSKRESESIGREEVWREAARSFGVETETLAESLRVESKTLDQEAGERVFSERLAALPASLTEHESVVQRRELLRSVAAALVGTGLPVERAETELTRLLTQGVFLEIGHDALGLPCYSTPEMLAIEREVVEQAQRLANQSWRSLDLESLRDRCRAVGFTAEQSEAALAATTSSAVAIVEGAPGVGKSTLLAPVVQGYAKAGCRVIGAASAWRIANMLRDDLGIEARATASWIARLKAGEKVLDKQTVLIVDEAGLLSSRDMHALLGAVTEAGAKIILVGDRQQLQAIGAGPGLDLVARAVEAARVNTIVRQREAWAREAITAFGTGQSVSALEAFADRGLLIEADGAKAAIAQVLDSADQVHASDPAASVLILAKSNAAVAAISQAARERHKHSGFIWGPEVSFTAATPSGHSTKIALAAGDKIRFLVRDDKLGVVNGSTATIVKVSEASVPVGDASRIIIEADIEGRRIAFDPMQLADTQGRPRLGWAYASTVYGCQGLTVDHAVVHLDHSYNRHDIYVATSRARERTTLVVDAKSIDRRLAAELPFDQQRDELAFSTSQRQNWLAERLSRASPKISTLDVIEGSRPLERQTEKDRHHRRELSYEL